MTDTQYLITSAFERSLETKRTLVDSQINELVEVVELVTHTFKIVKKSCYVAMVAQQQMRNISLLSG